MNLEKSNSQWDKEEFEDLVARSTIAMYETEIYKKCLKVPSFIRPTEKDVLAIKKFGCYFAPEDRIILEGDVDIVNDGFTKEASWCTSPRDWNPKNKIQGEYFRLGYMKLLNKAPPGVLNYQKLKYFGNHKIYKLIYFSALEKGCIHIQKSFVTIDPSGNIYDTYGRHPESGKPIILASGTGVGTNLTADVGWSSAILGYYSDSRFLWNVTALESSTRSTFGVYPEQVQSLFYARELPMTDTGRKRPILHWVASHQRRIKAGIEIDIEKHLRGINEFTYQGTKFIITRPQKIIKRNLGLK